ncbi:MAG: hypothetical protein HYU66_13625 [Armatimonadetes bacterium]|nr:hypothetical protein [Armatimonadota bacterium]
MHASQRRTLLGWVALLTILTACHAQDANPLRLTLPPVLYAVAGDPMGVWFDNLVLTETPEQCTFTVTCDLGSSDARHWSCTPTAEQVGDHPWRIRVADPDGRTREAVMLLRVLPVDSGAGRPLKLLIVGDSLTHATAYPAEIARLAGRPGNPNVTLMGTHKPWANRPEIAHEGYGGWTWQRFAAHYEPEPDGTYRKRSSPFVFMGDDGKPALDVARYPKDNFDGAKPDVVTFLLGINDCFGANPDEPANIDVRIDAMFTHADTLIAAFRQACPDADLGLCITTPPNSRESGFEANYKGAYHRWGWKRIQHRLVERELAKFHGRAAEHLFIVPTELNLDPVDGYPDNNGVHPNGAGYAQIGESIYAWLKARAARK